MVVLRGSSQAVCAPQVGGGNEVPHACKLVGRGVVAVAIEIVSAHQQVGIVEPQQRTVLLAEVQFLSLGRRGLLERVALEGVGENIVGGAEKGGRVGSLLQIHLLVILVVEARIGLDAVVVEFGQRHGLRVGNEALHLGKCLRWLVLLQEDVHGLEHALGTKGHFARHNKDCSEQNEVGENPIMQ